jgi:hypothetical protein
VGGNAALAAYVQPVLGGGQVAADMKHADIMFDGTSLSVQIDPSVPTPLLRALTPPDAFDPNMPWSVLEGKAHNFQYGWNPAGFWAPPVGTGVWIKQIDATLGLEVYHVEGPPPSSPYDPIFGTNGSASIWNWTGAMVHNAYAVPNPIESRYEATYRVYIGEETTGEETPGYNAAQVTFVFEATPILPGDYDRDLDVDANDLFEWRQSFGDLASPLGSGSDGNQNGIVDAADYTVWRDNLGAGTGAAASVATTAAAPEPGGLSLVVCGAAALSLARRRRATACGWRSRHNR